MVKNTVGRDIPQHIVDQYGAYGEESKYSTQYEESIRKINPIKLGDDTLVGSLREAIEKTGFQDCMITSFHLLFCEGDYVLIMVIDEIAAMGIKDLMIAPSLIANVHEPLIYHIKNG